jgi:ABC-type bacteriocin/lantibiotic exporter with double-glycine peptidase domain
MRFTDKYQPKKAGQIIGKSQRQLAENFTKLATGTNIKPIIIVGPSGSGKTTLAKMFASMLE